MNKLRLLSLVVAAIVGVLVLNSCQAVSVSQIDALKNQLLPPEYRNKNFTIDEVKKVLREKCKKAAGTDNSTLYADIEKGATQLMGCLSGLLNVSAIQAEIEQARPIGELDTVFHKYCQKAPEAEQCLRDFNAIIQPCLSAEERTQNAVMMRVTSSLLGFLCAKDGNQIALFVAEEGPECLEANREAIAVCLNSSFAEFLPKDGSMPDLFNLPELVLEPQHCVDLQRFESCTLHHLEQCREITPANVAESIFKFIKNETSCKSWMDAKANERPILMAAAAARNGTATLHGAVPFALMVGSGLSLMLTRVLRV